MLLKQYYATYYVFEVRESEKSDFNCIEFNKVEDFSLIYISYKVLTELLLITYHCTCNLKKSRTFKFKAVCSSIKK